MVKRIGIAMEGGGQKGASFPAALQAIESLGGVPREIVGVSTGSITGTLYAGGWPSDELRELADPTSSRHVALGRFLDPGWAAYLTLGLWLPIRVHFWGGAFLGNRLEQWVAECLAEKLNIRHRDIYFDDLPIPLHVVASDIKNGMRIIFDAERTPGFPVCKAVRMSASLPMVYTWKKTRFRYENKPRDDSLLMDGGLMGNLPLDVLGEEEGNFALLLDEGPEQPGWMAKLWPALHWFRQAMFAASVARDNRLMAKYKDRVIRLPVGDVSTFDLTITPEAFKQLSEEAEKAVKEHKGLRAYLEAE